MMNPGATLEDLPAEILTKIFGLLKVNEALKLSQTCKRLNLITQGEFYWQDLIRTTYGIDLRQATVNDKNVSSHIFFKEVLYRFGKFLGLWQRQTLGHYGALVQVVYEDWSLKLIEWCPPPGNDNPHLPLRPRPFVKIYVNDHQERCIELLDKDLLFRDVPEEALNDVIITSSKPNAMNVFLPQVKPFDPESNDDLFHEMLMDYVHIETGARNFSPFAIGMMKKFNSMLNCRNVHGYLRLDPEKYLSMPRYPIPSGVFKGTYGAHGIEIISLSYPSKNVLEGFKLTGDPNVPMGKVTFKADLTKSIRLTREMQKDFSCEALIPDESFTYESIDFEAADHHPQAQPFCMPSDAYDRGATEEVAYDQCQYRFLAEGQIAYEDYQDPKFVPAHLIIFDQDHFGVLFLTLHSMSLYVRISEDLSATSLAIK